MHKVIQLKQLSNYIKYSHRLTLSGIFATFSLCLFSLLTIFPLVSPEQKTEAATGTASTTSLTLSTTGGASLDLSVNNSNGTFNETTATTGQAQFTVTTTNYTGYTLSIQNSSSSTDLTATGTGTSGTGTSTIASIPTGSSLTSAQFNNATYNGKWGYKPSKLNSQPNSNYIPSPTTTATTLNITNCANGQSNGGNTCPDAVDSYTIDLAARLQYTQDAGNYTNTFIITAVGNQIDYSVSYTDESSASSDIPASVENKTDQLYITLSSTIPTREGYTFQGWCTTSTGADGTNPCTGTTYQPGDEYPINQTTQNLATLYAMWKKDIIAMQDMPDSQCTTDAQTIATDTRDDKTYTVQRLADGKCWMTSDLNLAGGTALYSDDSNVPTTDYTKASGNAYYTLPASQTITSGTSLPESAFSDDSTAYVFNTGNETTSQSDCTSSKPCNSYYSWLAATAGGKDASGSAVTSNGYNTAYSICPKGWRLPTSTTSDDSAMTSPNWKTGDWYALATAYGANLEDQFYQDSATFYNNAGPGTTPNFLLAGEYGSGSFSYGGSYGHYWSATSRASTSGYYLYFGSGYVYSPYNGARRRGLSVRCVKKSDAEIDTETELGISTMQDFGNLSSTDKTNLINKMEPEKAYYVTDSRDNEGYNIAKLADGKVWLLDNLRLGSTFSMTLRNTNTNITASTYTLPASWSSGFTSYTTAMINTGSKNTNAAYSSNITSTTFNANETAKIGVYYNYCAATAGDICSNYNYSSNASADRDICPKGWRMPTGGYSGEYQALYTAYSSNYQNFQTALRTPLSGYFNSNSAYNQGSNGNFWSATKFVDADVYRLYVDASNVNTQHYYNRRNGLSVRCVLK